MYRFKERGRFLLSLFLTFVLFFQSLAPGILAFAEESVTTTEESSQILDVTEEVEELPEEQEPVVDLEEVTEPAEEPVLQEETPEPSVEETPEEPTVPEEQVEAPSEESNETTLEEPEETPIQTAAETDFVTIPLEGGLRITDWTGTGNLVTIPDTIDGVPVVSIGKSAFQNNSLKEVTLGINVKHIDNLAFANNLLEKLNIPVDSALERIGEYAFLDNRLTSFTFPTYLKVIERGAFSDNLLIELNANQVIEEIHDYAFSKNNLREVSLGNSIALFGIGVFSDNGAYVKVNTENTVIPKLEKSPGPYGHVVGAVRVVLHYIDKTTGKELRSPKTVGDDMSDINNIFVIGEEVSVKPEPISGYVIQEEIFFTPDADLYVVELLYLPITTPPVIERILSPEIPVDTKEEDVEELLRSFVKATDLLGEDITDKIVIDRGDLDLTVPGPYSVKYSVEDRFGNSTEYIPEVMVGTDWITYPIGGGWVLGDFTYNEDIVTGLSDQGKAKLSALPAGQKHLILPPFSPLGERPEIKYVGDRAFQSLVLDSVDFVHMKGLLGVRSYAFNATQ